jgi:2-C-methyl-D-erythritol 4-phosphate cytidylyltransferase/2-C-methyl-D-erythritol 2,4-cyclodiphosphate synthase
MTFAAIVVAAGTGSRAADADRAGAPPDSQAMATAGRQARAALVGRGPAVRGRRRCRRRGPKTGMRRRRRLSGLTGWRSVTGGATRAESVRAGLASLTGPADQIVLIHDAARPLLGEAVIQRLLAALQTADGALPALPVADTLKKTSQATPSPARSTASTCGAPRRPRPSAATGWRRPGPTGLEKRPRPTTAPWSSATAARWSSSRATRD